MPQTHQILTSKVLISNTRPKALDQNLLINRNNIKILAQFVTEDVKCRTVGLGFFHQCIYLHLGGRESQKFSIAVAYHVASQCNTNGVLLEVRLLSYISKRAGRTTQSQRTALCRAKYYSAIIL